MIKRGLGWGALGTALLVVSAIVSLSLGSAQLPLLQVWRILLDQVPFIGEQIQADWPAGWEQIILQVRFPRVVLALLVGACLSVSGAGYQGVLRNPLADPYTLGVASGAAVGAAFLILFGWHYVLFGQWMIPVAAFITGLISLMLVFRLANIQGKFQMETLILSGVVIQAFLGAMVSFMVSMSDDVVNEIVFWMMGSLSMRSWAFSGMLLPYLMIGMLFLLRYSTALNLFALGERQASHMGVDVERTKRIVLIASTLMAAAAVSITGIIGFVGLVIPHMIRLLTGPDYRLIIPLSALFGGIYVLWADTLARMVLSPTEIPLGVVTAFLGAPFFAYLLQRNKRQMGG